MKLKEFAKLGGCTVVKSGAGWNSKYGYTTADAPNCSMHGYRTKREAYQGWLHDTFGAVAGAAVLALLEEKP